MCWACMRDTLMAHSHVGTHIPMQIMLNFVIEICTYTYRQTNTVTLLASVAEKISCVRSVWYEWHMRFEPGWPPASQSIGRRPQPVEHSTHARARIREGLTFNFGVKSEATCAKVLQWSYGTQCDGWLHVVDAWMRNGALAGHSVVVNECTRCTFVVLLSAHVCSRVVTWCYPFCANDVSAKVCLWVNAHNAWAIYARRYSG